MKSNTIVIATLVILILLGGGVLLMSRPQLGQSGKNYDEFAQCLSEKSLAMYGAAWCPHCQAEKKRFGDSFKYVSYIECPENTKLCLDKGVNSYPTWIDKAGNKYEGEQGLDGLARISQCNLPD